MTKANAAVFSNPVPPVVPVLSQVIPEADISEALRAALDARAAEHDDFMAMADGLVQSMRPELERLATDLVRQCLREAWARRVTGPMGSI